MQQMQQIAFTDTDNDGLSDEYETSVGLDPADARMQQRMQMVTELVTLMKQQQEQIQAMRIQIMMELATD